MIRFVYHYKASRQLSPGTFGVHDGIAVMEKKILTFDDYLHLKEEIQKSADEEFDFRKLTISSLSFLHETIA